MDKEKGKIGNFIYLPFFSPIFKKTKQTHKLKGPAFLSKKFLLKCLFELPNLVLHP